METYKKERDIVSKQDLINPLSTMVMTQLEPNTMDCSLIIGIKEPIFVSIESDSINAVVALRATAFNSSALGNSSRTALPPGQGAVLRCDVRVFYQP